MIQAFYVFIGGGLGAVSRFGIAKIIPPTENGFPFSTFISNVFSSLLLGFLMGYLIKNNYSNKSQLLLMTGFCGGFSTFSTYSAETFKLFSQGQISLAIFYALLSMIICVICIWIGFKFS